MASGPEHYKKAEQLLDIIARNRYEQGSGSAGMLAAAQIHATLAHAAATSMHAITQGSAAGFENHSWEAWDKATADTSAARAER
jgi:hypothetical protein